MKKSNIKDVILASLLVFSISYLYKAYQQDKITTDINHFNAEHPLEVANRLKDSSRIVNVDSLTIEIKRDQKYNTQFISYYPASKSLWIYQGKSFEGSENAKIDSLFSRFYYQYNFQYMFNVENVVIIDYCPVDSINSISYNHSILWEAKRKEDNVYKIVRNDSLMYKMF